MTNTSLKCGGSAWSITLCFLLATVAIMLPDLAAAQTITGTNLADNDNTIAKVICSIVAVLQGPIARGVAAFGIIFLGFSLFLGKISWGTALALGIGLGAIFGAQKIVNMMAGGGDGGCAVASTATATP